MAVINLIQHPCVAVTDLIFHHLFLDQHDISHYFFISAGYEKLHAYIIRYINNVELYFQSIIYQCYFDIMPMVTCCMTGRMGSSQSAHQHWHNINFEGAGNGDGVGTCKQTLKFCHCDCDSICRQWDRILPKILLCALQYIFNYHSRRFINFILMKLKNILLPVFSLRASTLSNVLDQTQT